MSEEAKATEPASKKPVEPQEGFLVTTSPHIRSRDDISRIMWTVVVALLPALFTSCYFFGMAAAWIVMVSVVTAVAAEALVQKLTGRKVTVSDGSSVVTGLLVAFVMPSNAPWFIPLVASLFAIGIVKQAFGGLGYNIWNPALAGRAFAVACFAGLTIGGWGVNWVHVTPGQRFGNGHTRSETMTGASALSARKDYLKGLPKADAVTDATSINKEVLAELGATPRETLRKVQDANRTPLLDMFLGSQVGCVGETSALALLVGAVVLLATKTIKWYIPVCFLGTVALLGWLLPVSAPAFKDGALYSGLVWCGGEPLFEMLAGGVMLGAVFMATDMVTSPLSKTGKLVFGFGCGLLTVIIRKYGGYPEGVCYSILLMNTATPLIDSFTKPRVYGTKKR